MECRVTVTAIATSWLTLALGAQDSVRVAPGDPVRVLAPAKPLTVLNGYFVGSRGDSLAFWIPSDGQTLTVIPVSSLNGLTVNHGDRPPRTHVGTGMLIGAAVGLTVSVTNSILYSCHGSGSTCDDAKMITAFTVGGALFGGVMAAFSPVPPYDRVALDSPVVRWVAGSSFVPAGEHGGAAVARGDRVRVLAPALGRYDWHGTFVAVRGDSVVLRGRAADSAEVTLPLAQIIRLDVNRGNRSGGSHAVQGLVLGALTGLSLGLITADFCHGSCGATSAQITAVPTIAFGALGLGIGALHTKPEPYARAWLTPQLSAVPLSGGRVGIGLGWRQ